MALTPCLVCRRHIRVSARACPFCQPALAAAIAIGLAFSACGGNAVEPPSPSKPAPSDARPERGDIYGVPQPRDAAPAPTPDARPAGPDAGRGPAAPIYGVPDMIVPPPADAAPQARPPKPRPRPPEPTPQPMYGVPRDRGEN